MPLKDLNCGGTYGKLDLTPLRGMPLNFLCVNFRQIDDLTPLVGIPLEDVLLESTTVKDLSPLKGMRLKKLAVRGSKVNDLSVIEGMTLCEISFNDLTEKDEELVRSIPTITIINSKPAAEFWTNQKK